MEKPIVNNAIICTFLFHFSDEIKQIALFMEQKMAAVLLLKPLPFL